MQNDLYDILKDYVLPYQDLGPEHFDSLNRVRAVNRLVHRLTNLGIDVTIKPLETAAW